MSNTNTMPINESTTVSDAILIESVAILNSEENQQIVLVDKTGKTYIPKNQNLSDIIDIDKLNKDIEILKDEKGNLWYKTSIDDIFINTKHYQSEIFLKKIENVKPMYNLHIAIDLILILIILYLIIQKKFIK